MNRILTSLLFLSVAFVFVGCSSDTTSEQSNNAGNNAMMEEDVQEPEPGDIDPGDLEEMEDMEDPEDMEEVPDVPPEEDMMEMEEPEPRVEPTPNYLDEDAGNATEGTATVLTYNVAGLPQGISSSNPQVNIPIISPLLNAYDLVLAQEDFWYHDELILDTTHPYVTLPYPEDPTNQIGDGLNRFSIFPFGLFERTYWGMCHGMLDCASDCLAEKGFSFARMLLANGVEVDVYNLHVEAGGCDEDLIAREAGIRLLIAYAAEKSEGRAIIMAGDFNLHVVRDPEDGVLYNELIDGLNLRDACWEVDCGDERIDRLLVRSSDTLNLEILSWAVPPEFVTQDNEDLSDHKPVAVEIGWQVAE